MKLINQSAEYLPQGNGIEGIYKQIELAGRTSYLSWDKMTEDSAKKFVDMLIKSKHTSVLEHGTVYLHIPHKYWPEANKYYGNPYTKISDSDNSYTYITTNYRVLLENCGAGDIGNYENPDEYSWITDLKFISEPTEFHEKRLSVKVVTSRGISHELVRHRSMSFIQESQRYCAYDKSQFCGEIAFIKPSWLNKLACKEQEYNPETGYSDMFTQEGFIESLQEAENNYMAAKMAGLTAQEARDILPNATKTTLVITAFESDWREWFAQRLFGKTGQPHPDMLVLANLIKEEFEKAGVWEGIMKYPSKYD